MLRTARSFSWLQWRIYAISIVMLPVIDQKLKHRGFVATRAWLDKSAAVRKRRMTDEMSYAKAVALAVSVASRRTFWSTSCLRQALWLEHRLVVAGVSCELKLGVRAGESLHIDAHAWVEKDGQVLIGGEDAAGRYVSLGSANEWDISRVIR
jgi:hypothetical protein